MSSQLFSFRRVITGEWASDESKGKSASEHPVSRYRLLVEFLGSFPQSPVCSNTTSSGIVVGPYIPSSSWRGRSLYATGMLIDDVPINVK
mmetsp:Transcript_628/g.993  ORF Transcript_628/g.993 Transcript_628/m.993 type:complete len:90 (+) Transcript_628:1129-1398(+)